ncbi:glycoside hydrolase family 2 TIM barrel-domain containing protein [Prevotella sp.]|uniref:glycoside hydrolase family 2 TIM barrel-domain containing protein n=1 Tax=Prevotella sp. TaxID=59823 RepID=UPI00307837C2
MNKLTLLSVALAANALSASAQRTTLNLKTWQFSRDSINYSPVTVPHDWAINGPFDKKWDLQNVAIVQNGETEKTEKSGRSGALPWIGRGFYKTTVDLKKLPKTAVLEFDGAMSDPHVYINGKLAGHWAYGYNAFRVDAAPYLKKGKNEISVSLDNREESSRWYPGGGLYRPVQLVTNADAATINQWGCYFRTESIADGKAEISICTNINNVDKTLSVECQLVDATGKIVAQYRYGDFDAQGNVQKKLTVDNAQLWSPESPYLYKLVTRLYRNNKLVDQVQQKVGIRTVRVAQYDGFQLNGVTRKIKGVCLHHDLGPLGAAVNKAALIRQVRTMKEMGCDAIRTAHNMPSTWQMEICDSMGMMVMAESFDMWIYPKCKNGYALNFKEWADKDIENLVLNHRNHPSIVMWSIGNEIPEQWSEEGRRISEHLQNLCHKFDPTRPVTQGMDQAEAALKSGFAQVMDVPGFNYRVHKYDKNIRQLPKGFLLGSETASTVSSRGVYKFPVEASSSKTYADGQCSSYDVEYCPWSNLPDDDWCMQDDRDYTIGEFVWTGYDYLGEPSPYDEYWPSRSSYFGICDLAGLPKDRYWLYRSHWRTDDATLHVLPHWTFPERVGETTPVYCYTSWPSAELFVNGKSQGRIVKNPGTRLDRYRLRWNNVKYEPGEIKVVAYDYDGTPRGEKIVRTAGAPARIVLKADRNRISSKGEDLSFVTVSVVDKNGTPCPTATNKMKFEVSGAGKYRAACNGDATSLVAFNSTEMPLFSGELVVVVEGLKRGTAMLSVSADGLPTAKLPIEVE